MRFEPTDLPGCFVVHTQSRGDARGAFAKTFHEETFAAAGLRGDWREQYHSHSRAGVVRGMHFQLPPADHAKLVYCLAGEVADVAVDLRVGSPAYGRSTSVRLSAANGLGLYVPSGCAHGFAAVEDSVMLYNVTSVHAPAQDAGIAWDSFGFDWPTGVAALLSDRDRVHPRLDAFDSPFRFDPDHPAR